MALAGLHERLRSMRLAAKLAWLSAALTAVFVATTLIPLSMSTRSTTQRIVAEQLARTQRAIIANQERELAALRQAATLLGQNARLRAAMTDDQTQQLDPQLYATTTRELMRQISDATQDIIVVADAEGRVFASGTTGGPPLPARTDLSTLDAVKVALDPAAPSDTGVYGVLDVDSVSYSVAAVPLVSGGSTLGALLVGERIDSAYLARVKDMFGGEVAIVVGDSQPGRGDVAAASIALGRNIRGAPVTMWLRQPTGAVSSALSRSILLQFAAYGLAAVILSALGAALVARSVLRPLERFIKWMQQANPFHEVPPRPAVTDASPEMRTLDESFSSLMTSLRDSEAQLRQSQKLEAVGTLAGGVAHDFNNLLTVMTGYTELAMMRNGSDERLKNDLTQVLDASHRASRLTHQLLAFSRKQALEPTVLDLNEVVGEIVPMLRRLIGEHIQIAFEPAPALPSIVADRGQLEQVIINLVVNARDAMPSGGAITVRTDVIPSGARDLLGEKQIPRSARDDSVVLSVADTGTGIPDHIRERIFEPFFTTKEPGKGTGLGLSMVYGIVKQSGGTIEVDSSPAKGTTFTIQFPASSTPSSPPPATRNPTPAPRGTETILLVEDEPELRELARRTLESLGYTVIAPEHTEDALAISISRNVDLLLTDIVMPVMSGPTIVRRLADVGAKPPVVYMTGYADETLSDYRIEAGSTLLRKPFSPSQLARVVREVLDRRGA